MGVLDKFLEAIKLNDDYDDDGFLDEDLLEGEDDEDFLDDDFDDKPKKKFFDIFAQKKDSEDIAVSDEIEEKSVNTAPKQPTAAKQQASAAKAPVRQERSERLSRPVASSNKITPMRNSRKTPQGANMEVCVIKPTSVEDAREITETLLNNRTVVLNVEGLDVEIAQRIIDFTSGSCFAISGNLQKISNYIFIITPAAVDISGDFLNIVDSFDTTRGLQRTTL